MNENSHQGSPREFFLSSGERVYLGDAEIEEILEILEERVAEWMVIKKNELTEEEYEQMIVRFLKMVKPG